ncbi:anaphase-promoting complex subunit 15B [Agrilus planipennis]|uniref:Anaphase-promoting complex subunit 15B n=1 Tax=Agrilus planipennis TaxID=224129 RepID=A0A1W4WH92_AGRPL|nr:anaphase-promoting complex subunit 15B [Agrilus planipennis]
MSIPLFPTLKPKLFDSAWFNVDQPCDDENEVTQLEQEYIAWEEAVGNKYSDITPIGKTSTENMDDEEEEDDEDDNDDDEESETHDEEEEEEIEMDVPYDSNSSVGANIRMVQGNGGT